MCVSDKFENYYFNFDIHYTFIDTPNCVFEDRVQYSTVHIPNVFCDDHLHLINSVGLVRIH